MIKKKRSPTQKSGYQKLFESVLEIGHLTKVGQELTRAAALRLLDRVVNSIPSTVNDPEWQAWERQLTKLKNFSGKLKFSNEQIQKLQSEMEKGTQEKKENTIELLAVIADERTFPLIEAEARSDNPLNGYAIINIGNFCSNNPAMRIAGINLLTSYLSNSSKI